MHQLVWHSYTWSCTKSTLCRVWVQYAECMNYFQYNPCIYFSQSENMKLSRSVLIIKPFDSLLFGNILVDYIIQTCSDWGKEREASLKGWSEPEAQGHNFFLDWIVHTLTGYYIFTMNLMVMQVKPWLFNKWDRWAYLWTTVCHLCTILISMPLIGL